MPRKKRTHECAGCLAQVAGSLVACDSCFKLLPGLLRGQLGAEARECRQAGIKHTTKLIELRHQAATFLRNLVAARV